jgi:hypothetical protein
LIQALATSDKVHPECLQLKSCESVSGLDYNPPVGNVDYQLCRDERGTCYYANSMYTCVCSDRSNIDVELQTAFQAFALQTSCATDSPQTFDQLLEKQVRITDLMVADLKAKIQDLPDVTDTLKSSREKLQDIWKEW